MVCGCSKQIRLPLYEDNVILREKIKWDRMRSLYFSRYVMLFTTDTLTLRFLASTLLFSWVLM